MNLKKHLIQICLLLGLIVHPTVFAEYVINSSVSPEFPNGLHAKYLKYLAEKLNKELVISPMPFARRIQALRKGEIDIMVGLQQGQQEKDEFVYVSPSYESLTHTLFVLKERKTPITEAEDLSSLTVAATINALYFDAFYENEGQNTIRVSTLKQKIDLLLKKRADTFIHFRESAIPVLERLKLNDKIVLAHYQPKQTHAYFVALSRSSFLFNHKEVLQQIISEGVKRGDFKEIRRLHYQSIK